MGSPGQCWSTNGAWRPATGAAVEPLILSDLAQTGLLTAFCRAVESRSRAPLLADPQAEALAARLAPRLAHSPSRLLRDLARGRVRPDLVAQFALRARKYDRYARDFVRRQPGGCLVNLGCGLDTRFWRIDDGRLRFYDLDLPEVIALKRSLVAETDRYHLIGRSVLDHRWMECLSAEQPGPCLFLAEGLIMYLPPSGVRALVLELQARFPGSELMFETVHAAWLKPWLKWLVTLRRQRQLGLGRGAEYQFGLRDSHELEAWSPGLRLLAEWTYLDEHEPRIGPLRLVRRWKLFRYAHWTVRYLLGPREGAEAPP
jgi:methyltransferase (TIGR00027 family)